MATFANNKAKQNMGTQSAGASNRPSTFQLLTVALIIEQLVQGG